MDKYTMSTIVSQVLDIKESAEKVSHLIAAYVPGESSLGDYTAIKSLTAGLQPDSYVMPPEQEFMAGSLGRVEDALKDEGIDYSKLVSFEDSSARLQADKYNAFYEAVRLHSVIADDNIKSQFDVLLKNYMRTILSKPVKELEGFEYPDPKDLTKKLERESAMFIVNAKDILKKRLVEINQDYLAYLSKGDKATYSEYLDMQARIDHIVFTENAYPYNVITAVRRELISENVEVANCIHTHGWVVVPVSKSEKDIEHKILSFNEDYQRTINSGHVDRTNIFAEARYRQLLKGRDKYIESLKSRTLGDIAKARLANPGDIIAKEALSIDSKQL